MPRGPRAIIFIRISFHFINKNAHFSQRPLAFIYNKPLHPWAPLPDTCLDAKTCCMARSWLQPPHSVPENFFWLTNGKPPGNARKAEHPIPHLWQTCRSPRASPSQRGLAAEMNAARGDHQESTSQQHQHLHTPGWAAVRQQSAVFLQERQATCLHVGNRLLIILISTLKRSM